MAWICRSATVFAAVFFATTLSAQPILPTAPAGVNTSVSYGIEFATIRAGSNLPFTGAESFYPVQGRGVVSGDYRMSRTEITTGQWLNFVNTFSTTSNDLWDFAEPTRWGARMDPSYAGPGARWQLDPAVSSAADRPVAGVSWRTAAMYCNWLSNGATSDPRSLTHGAYDMSTFGDFSLNRFDGFTDQLTHSPGAAFWIPSLDEWMRAAFTAPNSDRWWLSHYGSDSEPVSGLPDTPGAQTDAGENVPEFFPVNAYSAQSPWGLLGTSGGVNEWLEDAAGISDATGLPVYRSAYVSLLGGFTPEGILRTGLSVEYPGVGDYFGLRLAAAVPTPAPSLLAVAAAVPLSRRRR